MLLKKPYIKRGLVVGNYLVLEKKDGWAPWIARVDVNHGAYRFNRRGVVYVKTELRPGIVTMGSDYGKLHLVSDTLKLGYFLYSEFINFKIYRSIDEVLDYLSTFYRRPVKLAKKN